MEALVLDIDRWIREEIPIAIATVVNTWGSAPRPAGSKMAINARGEFSGSVSGGCVEGAVVDIALKVLETDNPQLVAYGVPNETAWEVGLACGGTIELFVYRLDLDNYDRLKQALKKQITVVSAIILEGPGGLNGTQKIWIMKEGETWESFAYSHLSWLPNDIFCKLESRIPLRTHCLGADLKEIIEIKSEYSADNFEIFMDFTMPPPTLIVIGGVHIAISLIEMAQILGFFTIVIDPRRKFATRDRFPGADRIIASWPKYAFSDLAVTSSTAVALLTHDPKIDDQALEMVLGTSVFYVGALGSRKTQKERSERMIKAGFSEDQVNCIRGPIGLNIGSRSPEEIALAIMAEVVRAKNIGLCSNRESASRLIE